MKKIISIVSVLAMIFSLMTTVAFADENNKVEWEKVSSTDTTITLKLVFTTNKNINSFGCYFDLSDAIANGVTAVSGTNISAKVFQANYDRKVIVATVADPTGGVTGRNELCEVTFTYGDSTKSFKLPLASGRKFEVKDADKEVITDIFTTTAIGQEIIVREEQKDPTITLDQTSATLKMGETETVTLVATTENFDGTVEWTSNNEDVAKVENGVVKAFAEGKATITAKAGTAEATCEITVEPADPKEGFVPEVKVIGDRAAYDGKTLLKLGTVLRDTDPTKHISLKSNTLKKKTRTTEKTIADLLDGEVTTGATITVDVVIGLLTDIGDLTDADLGTEFDFSLVD